MIFLLIPAGGAQAVEQRPSLVQRKAVMPGKMLPEQVDFAAVQVLHGSAAHTADVQMVFPAAVELIAGRIAAFLRGVAAQLAAFAKPGDGPVDGGLANGPA